MHAPTDWDEEMGSRQINDYIREEYLPRVFASGREVIGVPQHTPIAGTGGAKLVRDVAQRQRGEGSSNVPVVFPGYELTSSDQLQVVLLADPDERDLKDLDARVQERLELGRPGKNWHESSLPLEKLLLEAREKLRDKLVSLVVATGHKGILEDGKAVTKNRALYRQVLTLADGLILAGSFRNCHEKTQRLLKGELAEHGYPPAAAYLQSSDARAFAALTPSGISHVKLGSFTIEGLRQALLNFRTFVSDEPFGVPGLGINRVRVRNTVFFDDVQLSLSPHLTALVGGRGTGKSCLLEYVAHVCDYQRTGGYDRPNARILSVSDERTGEGTLLPTTVNELHVRVGEKHYRFERTGTSTTAIFECEDERCENGVAVSGASPAGLLNLRYFGQRELANIVRNPSFFTLDPSQREGINLFAFLKSDELSKVGEHERRAAELTDAIRKLSIDLAAYARELAQRPQLVSERERLGQELERLKKQASHPALQSHRDFLQLANNRESIFSALEQVTRAQGELVSVARGVATKLKEELPATQGGVEDSVESLRGAATTQTEAFVESMVELGNSWKSQVEGLRRSSENTRIDEAYRKHVADFAAAKKDMEAQSINLALLEPLQKRLIDIDARLTKLDEFDGRMTDGRTRRSTVVGELRKVRALQGDVYVDLAVRLTESTRDRVRMTVVRAGDLNAAVAEFQEGLKDKRRFRKDDAGELGRVLLQAARDRAPAVEPAVVWTETVDMLAGHFEARQDSVLARSPARADPPNLAWLGPMDGKLRDVVASFDDEQLGVLLCKYVPDLAHAGLRRRADMDQYIPISQASVGQKATALFLILLAQTDGLLVIDQPEDDLDNAFIADDILPALQELKHRQQIIFATHNANMLVNAEAEKVVVLDTEPRNGVDATLPTVRGRVEHEGGIDQSDLRERVTSILEGGREAFLSRERKYRFTDE
jgi:ABC-type Mn2+/Zn2+ transport system ATPase subunit